MGLERFSSFHENKGCDLQNNQADKKFKNHI